MIVDVVTLPKDLQEKHIAGRTVLVFDVLRATTTLTAAVASGANEVRVFGSIQAARDAAAAFDGPKLLCGEEHTLPPPGFDLGNSPGLYTPQRIGGKTLFFTTTNGTRAMAAVAGFDPLPEVMYAAALVNAGAAAERAVRDGRDVTLVCSGSDGGFSAEDFLGCGAVVDGIAARAAWQPGGDAALAARHAFHGARGDLRGALRETYGGHNNLRVGLDADVDFAARLDVFDVVAVVGGTPLTARR